MCPVHARKYDLAIVGSGIACTMTLLALSRLVMEAQPRRKELQIAVIEKESELWNGIAYGSRSSINSLVITSLREFVHDAEKASFIAWLETNKVEWLEYLRQNGGAAGARWIETNLKHIQAGNWDELFLPRFLYGRYNSEKLASALELLEQEGLAAVTVVKAEAIDIAFAEDGSYNITLETADLKQSCLRAQRVVLAIGSPPINPIRNGTFGRQHRHTWLNDIYYPSAEANLQRIYAALSAVREKVKRNILILGSNASSLETLYLINRSPKIKALANSIVIISRSGLLPYKICDQALGFEFEQLELLKQKAVVSSLELITAIKADIQRAEAVAVNLADLFHPASSLVVQLFQHMDNSEQESFFCQHGMTFTKLMRRAGREYREAADELAAGGVLAMVKGVFRQLVASAAGSAFVSATYTVAESEASITHPLPFAMVVNCGGFEELNVSSSRLISSLVKNNVCQVNKTNRGFMVNERLEGNRNLYIIGPLIGGNFNSKIRFWHVESAPRIHGLASLLADSLFDSLSSARSCASPGETAEPVVPADATGSLAWAGVQN